jgi:hypothetical protein
MFRTETPDAVLIIGDKECNRNENISNGEKRWKNYKKEGQ